MANLGSNLKRYGFAVEVDKVVESQLRTPNSEGGVVPRCKQSPILGVLGETALLAAY
jgi:hypothetical protein